MKKKLFDIFFWVYRLSILSKRFSRVSSFLIIIGSKQLNNARNSNNKAIILCKRFGIEDVKSAINSVNQNCDFYSTRRLFVKSLFYKYIDKKYIYNYSHYDYQKFLAINKKDILSFKNHLKLILFWLKKDFNLKAILTFNIMNFHERELLSLCQEVGINFAVAHKECIKSPSQYKIYGKFYLRDLLIKNFNNLYIGVYNEMEKNEMLRSNIPKQNITIVGSARSKFKKSSMLSKNLSIKKDSINILLLDIYNYAGLPYLDKKWFGDSFQIDWKETYYEVLKELLSSKLNCDQIKIRFRTKGEKYNTNKISNFLRKKVQYYEYSQLPLQDEFDWADYVIGLNSTSVIEGLANGKKVIVPAWHKSYSFDELKENGYLYELGESVIWARSKQEFNKLLKGIILGNLKVPNIIDENTFLIANNFLRNLSNKEKNQYGNWLLKITN